MADKAISELIAANQVTPTDLFVLEQSGTAKKLTGQILENWLVSFADGHGGIQSIAKVSTSGLVDTYRITLADTTTFDFLVTNGKSINSITKTGTAGLVDTYSIAYNDGTTDTFTVTNGAKGDKGDNTYTWIKYASQQPTASSHSFGDVPDDWIGIYFGASDTAPADWQEYSWFQIKGEKGDTGAAATLLSNVVDYQVSDSGTIIPSGAWQTNVPVVAQGKYLWARTTTTFNTGSPAVSYSVSRMGLDGTGSVSSIAGVSPDANGNVPLTAEDIKALSTDGGDMTGGIHMNGQPISGLNAPTANDQAANMGFVNQQVKKAAPRDLLDNSYFADPVNHRGKTTYTGSVYTIDRWMLTNSYSQLDIVSGGVKFSCVSGGTNAYPRQYLDGSKLGGKTFTGVVCLEDGSIHLCTGVFPKNVMASDTQFAQTFIKDKFQLSLAKMANGRLLFQLRVPAGESLTTRWAALYEGEYTHDTIPEYQSKEYGAELAECQRYCLVVNNYPRIRAAFITSNTMDFIIPTPVPMRISSPSIENNGADFTVSSLSGAVQNGFTFAVFANTGNTIVLRATKTAHGLTDGLLTSAAGKWAFYADL